MRNCHWCKWRVRSVVGPKPQVRGCSHKKTSSRGKEEFVRLSNERSYTDHACWYYENARVLAG